jgi:cytochrome P450 family 4
MNFCLQAADTAALSVGSTLFFLALNPEYQKRAMEEVDSVFYSGGKTEVSNEDLVNLKYVEMCWKEAMRLHPPIPGIGRKLSEDILLGWFS